MFLVLLTYKKPLKVIDFYLDEHIAFLEKGYRDQHFIFSGRRDPRIGGVILVNLDEEEEVKQIVSQDPFHIHQLADYDFVKFTLSLYDDRFSCFLR